MPEQGKAPVPQPDFVAALEAVYGPPSAGGFGSAVFFEANAGRDLEAVARRVYRSFLGAKWEGRGAAAWMGSWKEVFRRPQGEARGVVAEMSSLVDPAARLQVGWILEPDGEPERARRALAAAFDGPEVEDLRAYLLGDGEAMSGLLIAGRRSGGEGILLVFLAD